MRTRLVPLLTAMVAAAVLTSGVLAAEGARAGEGKRKRGPEVTPDQRVVVEKARTLQKETRIARLELALAEAKEASEREIARRAENVYRLQGRAHALRAKNPKLFATRQRQRARRGAAMGFGRGQQMGPQGPRGGAGMGRGMHQGMGPGMGLQMGRGMRQGTGPGMGLQMGRGMRQGMGPEMGSQMGRGMRQGMGPGMGPQMGRGMRQETGPAGPMMRGRHVPPMGPRPSPEGMPLRAEPPAEEPAE